MVDDVDAYIECAVVLAGDFDQRVALRSNQRDRFKSSALYDARGMSGALETAYHGMWAHYLDSID